MLETTPQQDDNKTVWSELITHKKLQSDGQESHGQ